VSDALKQILVIAVALLAVLIASMFLLQRRKRTADPAAYSAFRDQILNVTREKIGLPARARATEPWAVVMDWGVANGSATVVAIADGTASIYLSSGGGFIGGGQSHESIGQAAIRAVSIAAEFQPEMRHVTSYPLPASAEVCFYVLTDAGVFSASASEKELSAHRNRLYKLGDALQQVITQYRTIQSAK
jgi:hypothetical protein